MKFIDIIFVVGVLLLIIGCFAGFSLLRLSISKTKEELKDINVANLWVLRQNREMGRASAALFVNGCVGFDRPL